MADVREGHFSIPQAENTDTEEARSDIPAYEKMDYRENKVISGKTGNLEPSCQKCAAVVTKGNKILIFSMVAMLFLMLGLFVAVFIEVASLKSKVSSFEQSPPSEQASDIKSHLQQINISLTSRVTGSIEEQMREFEEIRNVQRDRVEQLNRSINTISEQFTEGFLSIEERMRAQVQQLNSSIGTFSEQLAHHLFPPTSLPTSTPTVPPYSPYKWTSVALVQFGTSNLQHAGTLSYDIPSVIPSSAREVLVQARLYSGTSNRGPNHNLILFTQIGTTRYEKYLYISSWSQDAVNTNSDNMWFPMPPNRRFYLTVPTAHGSDVNAHMSAIGYR